jgi:Mg2+ and Co2+ transporter CorA
VVSRRRQIENDLGDNPEDGKGDQTVPAASICHVVHSEQVGELHLSRDNLKRLLASGSFFWIDLPRPTAEAFAVLRDVFQFHPLAIEDSALRSAGQARRL